MHHAQPRHWMPARQHLTFIVHGARADLPELRHVVSWVRQRGHAVNVRVTWEPGDGIHLAAEAADRGTDVVIACGGDGTLNEVVNGLDGRDVALGVVPLGTANDFARQTGIPEDADHAMDVILRRKPVRIDTASMNDHRCVIEAMSRRDFARLAMRVKRGEHLGLPGVHYAQLPWLKVTGSDPLTVNLDGESTLSTVCDYRARRADLLVHVLHLPGEEPETT